MESLAKTRKIGGSLVVTIPKDVVREEGLRPGELVKIDVRKTKKSGFGMFRGIKSFTPEDEMKGHD